MLNLLYTIQEVIHKVMTNENETNLLSSFVEMTANLLSLFVEMIHGSIFCLRSLKIVDET